MKRIILSVLTMSALLCGCQKDHVSELAQERGTIQATIEEISATRTVMDENNNIRWSEDDQIVGFMKSTLGVKYQVSAASVGKTSASFEEVSSGGLNAGTELEHIIAYYPYSSSVSAAKSGSNYTLDVILPTEQTYVAGSFGNGAMPMVAVSETYNITFRNVCGGMKLQLKGTQKVVTIKVEGKNGELLSGAATVTAYTDETKPTITMASGASTSVTLDCGVGVQLNESIATEFIIALPPVLFSKGFTVTVTDDASRTYTVETDKANVVLRSSLLVMPEISIDAFSDEEKEPQEDDYIDEYGINHGQGIEIDGVVWAPVNCGYHGTDFKYGKLYQWGRKYGQGYGGGDKLEYDDNVIPEIVKGPVSLHVAQSDVSINRFYTIDNNLWPCDWITPPNDALWNCGTEECPIKTEYDPCPDGWRVPTASEYAKLITNFTYQNDSDQIGYWFSGLNSDPYNAARVFFPSAGFRHQSNEQGRGIECLYWTSTPDGSLASYINPEAYTSIIGSWHRVNAMPIRCVKDNKTLVPVLSVTLNMNEISLSAGESITLIASFAPENANHQAACWCTEDPSIAKVQQDGTIKAIAPGTTNIIAMVGMKTAVCLVEVTSVQLRDYVDEYGINHGKGTLIGNTVWSPVNCGYKAAIVGSKGFPYGKLYQWGRKYGQGYSSRYDELVAIVEPGPTSLSTGQDYTYSNVFFTCGTSADWLSSSDPSLWNCGTEEYPVKTKYDPCPDGWRVPTITELEGLMGNCSSWMKVNNVYGCYFSGNISYSESVAQIFLPYGGQIFGSNGKVQDREGSGYYWSSTSCSFHDSFSYFYRFYWGEEAEGSEFMDHGGAASVRCVQE